MSPRQPSDLRATLVGLEEDETNGHTSDTNPPGPSRLRPIRPSVEESVDRHGAQLDAILDDTRGLHAWRQEVDEWRERMELGLFEVLGLVKRAEDRAAHAERESKAAREVGERASQSNEIATTFVQKKLELDVRADEDALVARRKRNNLIYSLVKFTLTALLAATIGALFAMKGCHP